jgi:hypothetical protein
MTFTVVDPDSNITYPVNIRQMINDMQMLNLSMDPRSIADFGNLLHGMARQRGIENPQVKARIRVRYNGRPSQFFIDPDRDISSVKADFYKRLDWVFPILD